MSGNQEANAPHLRVSGVSKAFASTQALDGVDLEVRRGQIHALLGSNGSGKSTLIKVLAGVYTADQGTLEINGSHHDLTEQTPSDGRRAGLHFVHQETSIFPTLSVAENLVIGRKRAAVLWLRFVARSSTSPRGQRCGGSRSTLSRRCPSRTSDPRRG